MFESDGPSPRDGNLLRKLFNRSALPSRDRAKLIHLYGPGVYRAAFCRDESFNRRTPKDHVLERRATKGFGMRWRKSLAQ